MEEKTKEKYKIVRLNKGIKQKVFFSDSKDNIVFSKMGKIYATKDFFKILNPQEIKCVIYHERHHITKEGRFFLSLSNIIITIGGLLIVLFLLSLILIIPGKFNLYLSIILILAGLFILIIGYLFRWFLETICDANAVMNVDNKTFENAIKIVYKSLDKKRKGFKKFEEKYLLHVPPKLRLKIINSWDN